MCPLSARDHIIVAFIAIVAVLLASVTVLVLMLPAPLIALLALVYGGAMLAATL